MFYSSYKVGVVGREVRAVHLAPPITSSFLNLFRLAFIYVSLFNILEPQYSEWTVGSLSSVTCAPMFMQFTGCHQPVQGFYWPENAIDWLRKC